MTFYTFLTLKNVGCFSPNSVQGSSVLHFMFFIISQSLCQMAFFLCSPCITAWAFHLFHTWRNFGWQELNLWYPLLWSTVICIIEQFPLTIGPTAKGQMFIWSSLRCSILYCIILLTIHTSCYAFVFFCKILLVMNLIFGIIRCWQWWTLVKEIASLFLLIYVDKKFFNLALLEFWFS